MSSTVISALMISLTGKLMKMDISFMFYSLIFMTLLQIITAAFMFKTMLEEAKEEKHIKTIEIEDYII